MKKRAFTLIELLVVIAIIGILTGIVLVSLRGARTRARDARIRADLEQVRSTAELIYDRDNSYVNVCTTTDNTLNEGETELNRLESDISSQNGGVAVTCYSSADHYCVSTSLASGGNICISDAGMVGDDVCTAADSTCD